jgi:hypothetical protein
LERSPVKLASAIATSPERPTELSDCKLTTESNSHCSKIVAPLAKDVPMKLPRFRLRTLMIVVAIIAIAAYGDVLRRRRAEYLRRAAALAMPEQASRGARDSNKKMLTEFKEKFEQRKDWERRNVDQLKRMAEDDLLSSETQAKWRDLQRMAEQSLGESEQRQDELTSSVNAEIARWSRSYDHFSALRRKYERAARYPWLPVSPDPPDPTFPELTRPPEPIPPNTLDAQLLPAPPEPPPPGPRPPGSD